MSNRFVILRHELPADHPRPSHWDVLIEQNGSFATWWVETWPASHERTIAHELLPHRLEYWELEVSISAKRGEIQREDRGDCVILEATQLRWRAELHGSRYRGLLTLHRADASAQWHFLWMPLPLSRTR